MKQPGSQTTISQMQQSLKKIYKKTSLQKSTPEDYREREIRFEDKTVLWGEYLWKCDAVTCIDMQLQVLQQLRLGTQFAGLIVNCNE